MFLSLCVEAGDVNPGTGCGLMGWFDERSGIKVLCRKQPSGIYPDTCVILVCV